MASDKAKVKTKLNAEIRSDLKKRLDVYVANNNVFIYQVVEMALEYFLDEMEASVQ
jgi:hypothetical protein